jgi:MoaA/NifB/PqqE/SkfB family radical SAM enzyme
MNHLFYGIKFIFDHQILHKKTPLIGGIVVHNKCNLKCIHCRIIDRGIKSLTFEEAKNIISSFYKKGGRTIYFEGGEPFLWHDREYTLEHIVGYARMTGFLATIIYTNGTVPIETSAHTVFISLDGLRETHDLIRGKSFDRIMQNIYNSKHPALFINFTINNYNKNEIPGFCEFINEIKKIRGIFFYFHTPYYGYDELYIDPEERKQILANLLKVRKKYKILNSAAGLKTAIKNRWKRPLDICHIYEKDSTYSCCRYPGNPELCRNCGYLSYAEIHETLKLKPSAIRNAVKYF